MIKSLLIILFLALNLNWTYTWTFEDGVSGQEADSTTGGLLFDADGTPGNVKFDNAVVKNGSLSCRFLWDKDDTDSQNWNTKARINIPDVTIVDGTTEFWFAYYTYLGNASQNPSGDDWEWTGQNTGQASVIKQFRWHKTKAGGANALYNSTMLDSSNFTNYGSFENVTSRRYSTTPLVSGQFYYVEMRWKAGSTESTGEVTIWIDGAMEHDSITKTIEASTLKVEDMIMMSVWNQKVAKDQYQWVDDVYISTDARSPVFAGGGSDTTDPELASVTPLDGATGIALDLDPFVAFTLTDNESGINTASVNLSVEGFIETGDLQFGNDLSSMTVNLSNSNVDATISNDMTINWAIGFADLAGNVATTQSGSFMTKTAAASSQFGTGDAGNLDNYTKKTPSRWQTVDESGDIIAQINTNTYDFDGEKLGENMIYNLGTYREFLITFDARSDEDIVANDYADFAVLFDYVDADNYKAVFFAARLNGNDIQEVFEIVSGTRRELHDFNEAMITDNNFNTYSVRYQDSVLTVSKGGVVKFTATNIILLGKNQVGFGSGNDAFSMDDAAITDLEGVIGPSDPNRWNVTITGSATITVTEGTTIT